MHKLNVELLIGAIDLLREVMAEESEKPVESWEDMLSYKVLEIIDEDAYEQIWEHVRNDYR